MSELEEKLGTILSNPQMMQQILTMAQSLSATPPAQETPQPPAPPALPELDPGMLRALAGLAGQGAPDPNQKNLLAALSPYLSQTRAHKLEKAMRAAGLARAASAFLSSGGLQMLAGR